VRKSEREARRREAVNGLRAALRAEQEAQAARSQEVTQQAQAAQSAAPPTPLERPAQYLNGLNRPAPRRRY
jgi:hypothetical protein